jgi:hypothetical protein
LSKPHTIPQLDHKMTDEIKRSRYVSRDLAPEEWKTIITRWANAPNRYACVALELYGGAINAYPMEDSAFIHRDAAFDAFMGSSLFIMGSNGLTLAGACRAFRRADRPSP